MFLVTMGKSKVSFKVSAEILNLLLLYSDLMFSKCNKYSNYLKPSFTLTLSVKSNLNL